ncbi:MAG TPA: Nif3-like dinuclear metal center hexameric protein, partial [Chryseolinea sp.]|nr:Nif3-like dinuclear metal center hexameric protein [Chryseolinea sp.]
PYPEHTSGRRKFLTTLTSTVGMALVPSLIFGGNEPASAPGMSVQQVIDLILKEIPGAPFQQTVDTLKSGTGEQVVTGIVTTMFSTVEVIRKTAAVGSNFIIAHEPTFYGHTDETAWLETDSVYQYKRELLNKHKIAVWRFHDYWHTHRPDGVLMGVLTKMGWEKLYNAANPPMINHAGITLGDLVTHSRKSLGIRQVRYIGDPAQTCKRIALIPGAAGGRAQMQLLMKEKPDVLIVGEVHEWETAEYVRDAQATGSRMSLIVLGHAESEEPGMEWLVGWLSTRLKDIKVTHIASGNPFREG